MRGCWGEKTVLRARARKSCISSPLLSATLGPSHSVPSAWTHRAAHSQPQRAAQKKKKKRKGWENNGAAGMSEW